MVFGYIINSIILGNDFIVSDSILGHFVIVDFIFSNINTFKYI